MVMRETTEQLHARVGQVIGSESGDIWSLRLSLRLRLRTRRRNDLKSTRVAALTLTFGQARAKQLRKRQHYTLSGAQL